MTLLNKPGRLRSGRFQPQNWPCHRKFKAWSGRWLMPVPGGGNDPTPPIGIKRAGPKLEGYMRSSGVIMQVGWGAPSDCNRSDYRSDECRQRASGEAMLALLG